MARIVSLRSLFLAVLLVGSCLEGVHAYHDLESVPRNYRKGEHIEFKVNQLRSTKVPGMTDPYQLPLCRPKEAVMYDLKRGQAFDRVTISPYSITMLEDVHCAKLCVADLGQPDARYAFPNSITRDDYHQNWLIDGLPAAMKREDRYSTRTRYWGGIPVGFVGSDGTPYINNHVNIEIYYRPDEGAVDAYHVVRVLVQPFSIRHEFEMRDETIVATERTPLAQEDANITNPIKSCDPKSPYSYHTDYDMVKNDPGKASLKGQPTSGLVLFTYDVIWKEDSSLSWASRWDVYLTIERAGPGFHWINVIVGSVFAIILLTAIVLAPIRHLRREISRFKSGGCEQEGYGWTLLHGDVFRPPSFCPDCLAIAAGSGAHHLATILFTLTVCSIGYHRSDLGGGSLLIGVVLVNAVLGCVGGYVTVFLFRIFGSKNTNRAKWVTGLSVPGLSVPGLLLLPHLSDAPGEWLDSAVPILATFWLLIVIPSCLGGAWLCQRRGALSFPVAVNPDHRDIPRQSRVLTRRVMAFASGIAGFVVVFAEYRSVLASLWFDHYYTVGFAYRADFAYHLCAWILLMLVTAEMTILGTYMQLNRQDYQWWWRSFYTGGATAFVLFCSLLVFLLAMGVDMSSPFVLVVRCLMAVICFVLFLALGFVGLAASLLFTRFLYGSIPWSMDVVDVVVEAGAPEVVKLGGMHQQHSVAGDDSESSVVVVYHLVKKARYRHPKHNTNQTNSLA